MRRHAEHHRDLVAGELAGLDVLHVLQRHGGIGELGAVLQDGDAGRVLQALVHVVELLLGSGECRVGELALHGDDSAQVRAAAEEACAQLFRSQADGDGLSGELDGAAALHSVEAEARDVQDVVARVFLGADVVDDLAGLVAGGVHVAGAEVVQGDDVAERVSLLVDVGVAPQQQVRHGGLLEVEGGRLFVGGFVEEPVERVVLGLLDLVAAPLVEVQRRGREVLGDVAHAGEHCSQPHGGVFVYVYAGPHEAGEEAVVDVGLDHVHGDGSLALVRLAAREQRAEYLPCFRHTLTPYTVIERGARRS